MHRHEYEDAVLEILSRPSTPFARRKMLSAVIGGSEQVGRKIIGGMAGWKLRRHNPFKDTARTEDQYPPHWDRIYSLKDTPAKFNWHAVGLSDILLSLEACAKQANLPFRHRTQIIGDLPLSLPAHIEHQFKNHHETYDAPLQPDELCSIGLINLVIEYSRGTETVEPQTFKNKKSELRSILQYRDVLRNQTYKKEWKLDHIFILNVFSSEARRQNAIGVMQRLNIKSQSMLFLALPQLASRTLAPQPVLTLLDDPIERVGHPPLILGKEAQRARATTTP